MKVEVLDVNNFDEGIGKDLVLVDFFADWCGPCQILSPILGRIAEVDTSVKIRKVDVDQSPEVAQKYGVMSMPTMVLFKDGVEVSRKVGLLEEGALKDWISSNK